MSLYRRARSPYWHYDFWCGGHRFQASTKATNKREAKKVEDVEREKAERRVAQIVAARTSLKLQDVATRYWNEVGEHHKGSANTWHQLGKLMTFFGPNRLLTEIADSDVAALVAWRRGHPGKAGRLLSVYAVNDTTEQLKKLFTRAKIWGVQFEREPIWKKHWLKEPEERIRELVGNEAERIEAATRDDYLPFVRFAQTTGMRLNECLLKWSEVDWDARQIRKRGKGGRLVTRPITSTIRKILWPLQGHHGEFVFTFVATRTRDGRIKGERYPITYNGLKSHWRYLRKQAGISDFRWHDLRHDFGTKLLRETRNLKLVQRAMGHAKIGTTARYAHVLDDDIAEGMEAVERSRTRSLNKLRNAS